MTAGRARRAWTSVVLLLGLAAVLPATAARPAGAGGCGSGRLTAAELATTFAGTPAGVAGSDYARALPLGDDRVLWTFQDVFLGSDDDLRDDRFVHNAALLQEGRCFRVVHGGTASRPSSWISRTGDVPLRRWLWPLDAEVGPDGLIRLVVAEMTNPTGRGATDGAEPVGAWLATVRPADLSVVALERAPDPGPHLYGWSIVSDDTFSYLFSHCYRQFVPPRDCGGEVRVARVPRGQLQAAPSYWTGSGWSDDRATAAVVHRRDVVTPVSVERVGGRFVSVTKLDDWFGSELVVDVAERPEGPWVEVARHVVEPRCAGCNTYGAHLLPWLDASGELLVVLSSNAWDMRVSLADGSLYRPAALTVPYPLPAAPVPDGEQAMLVPLPPRRLTDTRDGTGGRVGALRPGEVLAVGTTGFGLPPGSLGLQANLVATDAVGPGHLQAWPCDRPPPPTSVLNFDGGPPVANAAALALSAGGEVCIRASTETHLVIDVSGALVRGGTGVGFVPRSPVRVLDTRPAGTVAEGEVVRIDLRAVGAVPAEATAVTATFTVTDVAAPGFLTVWPCDAPVPLASSVNARPGVPMPNTVTVPVAGDGTVCTFGSVRHSLIVDVAGWWSAGGSPVRLEAPRRGWDSRTEGVRVPGGRDFAVPLGHVVATEASAAMANLVVTEATAPGYLSVWPCGSARPTASIANYVAGTTRAAAVPLLIDDRGRTCIYTSSDVHVVVDVVGWTGR